MRGVLEFIHLAAVSVWVGSLVFFSFVAAPALFRHLSPEAAGEAVSHIFPLYYRLGAICGAAGALSALALARRLPAAAGRFRLKAGALVLMVILTLYASERVAPRAGALRAAMHAPALEGGERAARRAAFAAEHRKSVGLNGAVLLLGAGLLVLGARDAARARRDAA
jgi:putative copper export protein